LFTEFDLFYLDRTIGSLVILAHTILYEFKSIKFQFHSMHTVHTKLFLILLLKMIIF